MHTVFTGPLRSAVVYPAPLPVKAITVHNRGETPDDPVQTQSVPVAFSFTVRQRIRVRLSLRREGPRAPGRPERGSAQRLFVCPRDGRQGTGRPFTGGGGGRPTCCRCPRAAKIGVDRGRLWACADRTRPGLGRHLNHTSRRLALNGRMQ